MLHTQFLKIWRTKKASRVRASPCNRSFVRFKAAAMRTLVQQSLSAAPNARAAAVRRPQGCAPARARPGAPCRPALCNCASLQQAAAPAAAAGHKSAVARAAFDGHQRQGEADDSTQARIETCSL